MLMYMLQMPPLANELQARVNIGNRASSDIFVSIHCNAFTNPSANGNRKHFIMQAVIMVNV